MSRLLVEGGTVVTASGPVAADVLVDGEKVVALLAPGSSPASSLGGSAARSPGGSPPGSSGSADLVRVDASTDAP